MAVHQGVRRILGDILAPEALDAIRCSRITHDNPQGVLDFRCDTAIEVLPIQEVTIVSTRCQQASGLGLQKEPTHFLGKEKRSHVSEDQRTIRSFGRLQVDQRVLDLGSAECAKETELSVELSGGRSPPEM